MTVKIQAPKDRHKKHPLQLRIHLAYRRQLELLVNQHMTTLTEEITLAIRERLEKHNLWPPSIEQSR